MTKASEQKQMLKDLNLSLVDEQIAYVQKEKTAESEKYRNAQTGLLESIRAVGRTGDPALILAAEKAILVNEKRNYGNSTGMIKSLNVAILEVTTAEKMLDKVQDPVAYKSTNEDHGLPRKRIRGVPRDDARSALSSHLTRLLNMDKSRLSETEKQTVKARRSSLRKAEKAYTLLQHKALGLDPEQSRDRGLKR